MADEHIATYLNDHLAGSVVALELLEHLLEDHSGTPLETFFAELRADIEADRQELESLMERLNVTESRTRKASAWLAGKFAELKLRIDDPSGGELRLFESLEALALGIEGSARFGLPSPRWRKRRRRFGYSIMGAWQDGQRSSVQV